jgi:hypothetical protein
MLQQGYNPFMGVPEFWQEFRCLVCKVRDVNVFSSFSGKRCKRNVIYMYNIVYMRGCGVAKFRMQTWARQGGEAESLCSVCYYSRIEYSWQNNTQKLQNA